MASNITSAAAFATTNMKPDPGEQADALWAQKIADNTGYLVYRRHFGPQIRFAGEVGATHGTLYLEKVHGMTKFQGSFYARAYDLTRLYFNCFIDGGTAVVRDYDFLSGGAGTTVNSSFSVDISALTTGAMYKFGFSLGGQISGTITTALSMTTWQAP